MGPQNLRENVAAVRERIARAAGQAGRDVRSITLLAVSKGQPEQAIREGAAAGLVDFGESYLQEALDKLEALRDLDLRWHFIGRMQANKTRLVAEHFDWVHSIDRAAIAERLSRQRPFHAPPLNLCLQVNVGGQATKGGVSLAELPRLAAHVASLPRVTVRGLMCIPPPEEDLQRQRRAFAPVRELYERLNREGARFDTLSLGMSGDLEAAILEGSTMVRIGTALFGPRPSLQSRTP